MSREIDEKIVQMKFENGQFEKGVQTSIHSLEELKKGLDFKDASKGMENLDKSVKGLKFDGLTAGIEALNNRFTLLGITGLNVMNRIANAAINTGERMVKSLSVDQISAGWDKYAEKTAAVQTIMSATAKDFTDTGEQMAFVNSQLEKLNWFTDETSFNFLDMVSNIGKFTSNNIPLDQSVTAIQGIATWAAQAGANATNASHAMYQLSQALATGKVTMLDWRSVETANMVTSTFKQTVIDTALAMGTLVKQGDKVVTATKGIEVSARQFNSTLAEGWFTSEVLVETLNKYGGAANKLNEVYEQTGVTTSVLIDYIDDYTNSTGRLTQASTALGKSQEDTQKIFTKFEKTAKDVTSITDKTGLSISELVSMMDEYNRGTLNLNSTADSLGMSALELESTLQSFKGPMSEISNIVSGTGLSIDKLIQYVADYSSGTFDLAAVSEELGLTTEETTKIMEEFQTETMQFGLKAFKAAQEAKTFEEAIKSVKDAVSTKWMSTFEYIFGDYEQAKELWTNVANILYKVFAASGDARNEMMATWSEMGGREYAIASLYNLLTAVLRIMASIKKAWLSVFPAQTAETLFELTKRIAEFTDSLKLSKEGSSELYKVFRTLFLLLDTARFVVSQAVKAGFDILSRVLKELNIDISGFTDGLLKGTESLNEYVKNQTWMTDAIDKFGDILVAAIRQIKSFLAAIRQFGPVKAVIDAFQATFTSDFKGIGSIITFLGNTFSNFIALIADTPMPKSLEDIHEFFVNFGKTVSEEFNNAGLDFSAFEKLLSSGWAKIIDVMELFVSGVDTAKTTAGGAFSYISSLLKDVDWAGVALLATGVSILYMINKITDAVIAVSNSLLAFTNIGKKVQDVMKGAANVLNSTAHVIESAKWAVYGAALIEVGVAIMFLATALTVMSKIPASDLDHAAFVLGVVAAAILFFTESIGKLPDVNKATGYLLSFAVLLGALSLAMNTLDVSNVSETMNKIYVITIVISEFLLACLLMSKIEKPIVIGVGSMIGIVASIWLLIKLLNELSKYDQADLFKAVPLMVVLGAVVVALGRFAGTVSIVEKKTQIAVKSNVFRNLLGVVIAMYALVHLIKKLGSMDPEVLVSGVLGLIPVLGAIMLLCKATWSASVYADKSAKMILWISIALNLLIPAIKHLADIPFDIIAKGSAVIFALIQLVFKPLIKASQYAGANAAKAGLMLLSMAAAMSILQLVVKTLGKLDLASLVKGTAAVSILMLSLVPAIEALGESNAEANKGLIKLAIIVGLVGTIVFILAKFTDTTKALAAAGSMATILMALAVPMHIMDSMKNPDIKFPTQWLLIIGVFGAIVIALSRFTEDGPKALMAAGAMSAILIAMAAALKIMNKTEMPSWDKGNSMMVFIGLIGAIMIGLGAVSKIANPVSVLALTSGFAAILLSLSYSIKIMSQTKSKPSLANAKAMSEFVMMIGLMMIGLGIVSSFAKPVESLALATGMSEILIALGVSAKLLTKTKMPDADQTAQLLGFAAVIGILIASLSNLGDVDRMIPLATGISELIMAMSASVWLMSAVKDYNVPTQAIKQMVAFAVLAGVLIGVLSNVVKPDTVLPVATGLSLVMLAMAGVVIILGAVPTPNIATATNALGALTIFVGGMGLLLVAIGALAGNSGAAEVIKGGGEVLTQIGIAIGNFVGGIVGGFIGGAAAGIMSTFPLVCAELYAGSVFLVEFTKQLSGMPMNVLELIGTIVGVVAAITAAEFISGLKALPGIGQILAIGMATLPADFASLGIALQAFADNLGDIDTAKVKNAADAVKALADANNALPTEGGLSGILFGDIDLTKFVDNVPKLGEGLAKFAKETEGITKDTVQSAVDAAGLLVELEKSLPREGGRLQKFIGEQDIAKFGQNLTTFAVHLAHFGNYMAMSLNEDGVEKAKTAGQMLVDLENSLPREGGVLQNWFIGEKNLATFGTNLTDFGAGLVALSEKGAEVNSENVGNAITAGEKLADLENSLTKESGGVLEFWFGGESSFKSFGDNLAWFGEGLRSLSNKAKLTDFTIIDKVISFIQTIGDAGDIGTSSSNLVTKVKELFNQLNELTREQSHDIMLDGFQIAKNLINGLSSGIDLYKSGALEAVSGLAKSLVTRFEEELKIHSPSLVMTEEGMYVVQGIAEGINGDMSAEEAASQKAQNIVGAFRSVFDNSELGIELGKAKIENWKLGEGRGAGWQETLAADLAVKTADLNAAAEKLKASYAKFISLQQSGANEKSIKQAELDYVKLSTNYMTLRNEIIDAQIESAESMIEELNLLDEVRQAEYNTWLSSAEGKHSSAVEQTSKQMQLLVSQLQTIAKTTSILRSKYQAILEEFGEDSTEARNAYIKALNSEQKLNETYDSILEKQKGSYETIREARDASLKEYIQYMSDYGERLKSMGIGQEQIEKLAKKDSKFDQYWGEDLGGGVTKEQLDNIMNSSKEIVDLVKEELNTAVTDGTLQTITTKLVDNVPIAITDGKPKAVAAMDDLGEGLMNKIDEYVPETYKKGLALIGGLEQGIKDGKEAAISVYEKAMNDALKAGDDLAEINSPSKKTMQTGAYLMEGLAIGIRQNGSSAVKASEDVMGNLIDGTALLTNRLSDAISADLDLTPTITPVLNMDDVIKGSKSISGLLNSNAGLNVSSIDLRTRQVQANLKSDGTVTPANTETIVNNNFTQNNYSPKALSRYDIYRQTRNQILQLKGVAHK